MENSVDVLIAVIADLQKKLAGFEALEKADSAWMFDAGNLLETQKKELEKYKAEIKRLNDQVRSYYGLYSQIHDELEKVEKTRYIEAHLKVGELEAAYKQALKASREIGQKYDTQALENAKLRADRNQILNTLNQERANHIEYMQAGYARG